MTSPIFFSPIARREYQVLAGLYKVPEMHSMIDYFTRCSDPSIEGQTMSNLKFAHDHIVKVVSQDQKAKDFYNPKLLEMILEKIERVVLLNRYSALESMQDIQFWLLNEAGENVLRKAIERDTFVKDSEDYNNAEAARKENANYRAWAKGTNHDMAEAVGKLKEYEYIYESPDEPKDWDAYEESVMSQKPAQTENPAVVLFNENKMKKHVHSRPAVRVMEIYERNRRKGVAEADADEVLVRAIEREKEFAKLPLAERQILAATLKCMVNMKLAKGNN